MIDLINWLIVIIAVGEIDLQLTIFNFWMGFDWIFNKKDKILSWIFVLIFEVQWNEEKKDYSCKGIVIVKNILITVV